MTPSRPTRGSGTRSTTAALLAAATALAGLTTLPPTPAYAAPDAPRASAPSAVARGTDRGAPPTTPRLPSGWTPRRATYPGTVTTKDLAIPMSDGTVLRGDLMLPARADGTAVGKRFPVIVTITAYNKTVLGSAGGLGGTDPSYLVRRGYAQLTVDARGTGSSGGTWGAFSPRENRDGAEVVTWAHSRKRPWSDGRIGMSGPSYMGINQVFTAAQHPAGLRAIFPQVPAADTYRDVVASGGQIDVGFIPLWMGLVTSTGIIPPATLGSDPGSGLAALAQHLIGAGTFTLPLLLDAALGGDAAYDGSFYRERSPIEVIDRVRVPTFLIGGEFDLFQRGTPLLYEHLHRNGVPTKLIVGPGTTCRAPRAPRSARPGTARWRRCSCAGSTTTCAVSGTAGWTATSRRSPATSRAAAVGAPRRAGSPVVRTRAATGSRAARSPPARPAR